MNCLEPPYFNVVPNDERFNLKPTKPTKPTKPSVTKLMVSKGIKKTPKQKCARVIFKLCPDYISAMFAPNHTMKFPVIPKISKKAACNPVTINRDVIEPLIKHFGIDPFASMMIDGALHMFFYKKPITFVPVIGFNSASPSPDETIRYTGRYPHL